jgi:hypothetical protein
MSDQRLLSHEEALEIATSRLADPGSLEPAAAEAAADHLRECASCRDSAAELSGLWHGLDQLTPEAPPARLRHRVDDLIEGFDAAADQGPHQGPGRATWDGGARWRGGPILSLAAALLVGLAIGWWLPRSLDPGHPSIAGLHQEVAELQRLIALGLLQQDSAVARLQGVSYSARDGRLDPELVPVLIETLRSDPNVNVRLAALDALAPSAGRREIRTAVADSLPEQHSPLVQIAVVDLLCEVDGAPSRRAIELLLERTDLHPEVREFAVSRAGIDA